MKNNKKNNKKKILLIHEGTTQIAPIYELMKENNYFNKNVEITLFKNYLFKKIKNKQEYLDQFDLILSQNWLNSVFPEYKKTNKKPIFIELFHGTMMKAVPDFLYPDKSFVDYIASPNEYTTRVYESVGYDYNKILKMGYPRTNFYLNQSDDLLEQYYEEIGLPKNKKIILFAPSWTNSKEKLNLNVNNIVKTLSHDEHLLIISHQNSIRRNNLEFIFDSKYDEKITINKKNIIKAERLIPIIDGLYTDYSSIIFDFINLRGSENAKFFFPDIDSEQDKKTKNFYKEYYKDWGNNINGVINKTTQELPDSLTYYDVQNRDADIKIFNLIKSILFNKLVVVVPMGEIDDLIFKETLNHINKNRDHIKKVILLTEKDNQNYDELGGLFEVVKVKKTTKPSKLIISNEYIEDDDWVIVLDADDQLRRLRRLSAEIKNKIKDSEVDLLVTNIFRKDEYKIKFRVFDKKSHDWRVGKFPYFGNHSIIVKGNLYKETNELISGRIFQKHEDVVRSLIYLSNAHKVKFLKHKEFVPIARYFWNNHPHASKLTDSKKIASYMSNLIKILSEIDLKYNSKGYLKKSQKSSLIEIEKTIDRLVSKKLLSNDEKIIFDEFIKNIK